MSMSALVQATDRLFAPGDHVIFCMIDVPSIGIVKHETHKGYLVEFYFGLIDMVPGEMKRIKRVRPKFVAIPATRSVSGVTIARLQLTRTMMVKENADE